MHRAAVAGGGDAGANIAEIVEVGAERDRRVAEPRGDRRGDVHQLGLAQRAAVRRVVGEAGDLELVRVEDVVAIAEAELGGERAGVGDLGARHRRRDRGDGVAVVAERIDRDLQQERRVDAAGERDDDPAIAGELGTQLIELFHGIYNLAHMLAEVDHPPAIGALLDTEDLLAPFAGRSRDIAGGRGVVDDDAEGRADRQRLERELGADKSIGTDLAGEVERLAVTR